MGALRFVVLACSVIALVWVILIPEQIISAIGTAWAKSRSSSLTLRAINKWPLYAQFAFLLWVAYWLLLPPTLGKGVVLLGLVAGLMSLHTNMKPWHRTVWIFIFSWCAFIEFRSIDIDHQQQENTRVAEEMQFRDIGSGIKKQSRQSDLQFQATVDQMQEQFSATMKGFSNIYGAQHEQLTKEEQLLKQSPSQMRCKDLADAVSDLAKRMTALERWYTLADRNIDLPIYNEMTMGDTTVARRQELKEEEKHKLAALRGDAENAAKPLIDTADRLRGEMVSRLAPGNTSPEDDPRKAWFQHPAGASDNGTTYSFVEKLEDNASYLNNLAMRMLYSCDRP
jgi:hypothetical protein